MTAAGIHARGGNHAVAGRAAKRQRRGPARHVDGRRRPHDRRRRHRHGGAGGGGDAARRRSQHHPAGCRRTGVCRGAAIRRAGRARRRRRAQPVRRGRAGRHRGHLDRAVQAGRPRPTRSRSWCCSPARSSRPAAPGSRRWGRSIARATSKVYIDLAFFRDLQSASARRAISPRPTSSPTRSATTCRTCSASSDKVERDARQRMSKADANALSVRLELQADCFAGVWAHHAQRDAPGPGAGRPRGGADAPRAPSATTACRSRAQGHVVPESFTHGTSAQRVPWFKRGFETGQVRACDTFSAQQLG